MSRNRIITIVLSFLLVIALFFIGLKLWIYTHPQDFSEIDDTPMSLEITTEDDLIMQGLWYEEQGDLNGSYKVFSQLYDTTHAKVYLLKKINSSLLMNRNINESKKELETLYAKNPNDIEVLRLLVALRLVQKDFPSVKRDAEHLVSISKDPMDIEIASDAMLYADNPNRALTMLTQLYDETKSEDIAMRIATILSDMYGENTQAIDILEEHSLKFESQNTLYEKLLDLYAKTDNANGVIKIAQILYDATQDVKYLNRIVALAWKYYENGKCREAQDIVKNITNTKVLNEPKTKEHWLKIQGCNASISKTTSQVHK